jgi:glycosyltransferase involved in cell wall biosynthesis
LCLSALADSDYPDFEAIVADDGSTESIQSIVEAHGFNYLRLEGPLGPARARNSAAQAARGKYLLFIDSDVCVHRNTLSLVARSLDATPHVSAVIGSYDDAPSQSNFLSQYKNLFHHYIHQTGDGITSTFWTGCGAIRKDLFVALGGFDYRRYRRPAIEDIELGTVACSAGHRIILDKRIVVKHLKLWTLRSLLKTDIFDRGIPWTRLMLRTNSGAKVLNVKPSQRISVALAYLTVLSALLGLWWASTWFGTVLFFVIVTLLNFSFYHYLFARRGLLFVIRVIPLHWLYFWYCGIAAAIGAVLYYFVDRPAVRSNVKGSHANGIL